MQKISKLPTIASIVFSVIAFIAATVLTVEKIELWKNPDYIPSCSWNPLFSCQGPMNSWQSSVFFVPSPILGMVGFAVVAMFLAITLFAPLPKILWQFFLTGVTFTFGFMVWLLTQSVYDIQALCLYCMVVWAAVIPLFWLTVQNYLTKFHPENNKAIIVIRLIPALIILTYAGFILPIYIQFQDAFNFMLGFR